MFFRAKAYILPLLILTVLIGCVRSPAYSETPKAEDVLKKKQAELNSVYDELVKNRRKLRETKEQEQNVIQRLFVINHEINRTGKQLGRANVQIKNNEQRIGYLRSTLVVAQKKMENRSELLRSRMREIYKNRGVNLLELLLTSDTLGDFISRTYFFEKVLGRDSTLLTAVKQEHKQITENKKEIETVTQNIKGLARDIAEKKSQMEQQADEKKKLYGELEERRKEFEARIAAQEETSKQIEALIKKILADRASKGVASPHGSGSFIWPVRGRLTSLFGYRRSPFSGRSHMHTGLDIANSYGTPVQAADGGEIIFAGWWDGYGKAVIIDHGKGISTLYGHMSRIYVQKDQNIQKGHVVGLIGSTGFSTGPHLHFEVRKAGAVQNPLKWLP